MARKKHYKAINIDVEPFLSIMAIVLKLISLILVVIVMRIALNPHLKKIVALPGLWEGKTATSEAKEPTYLDCFPDRVMIYPAETNANTATWEDLQRPENVITRCLDYVQANRSNQYVVIMARPQSVKIFRHIRKLVSERPIEVGYDAVEAKYRVDWDSATKALNVTTNEEPAAATPPAAIEKPNRS